VESRVGERIGRYPIDRKIGSGGMADAYRCVLEGPQGFQKFVLVKILKPEHRDSSHYYGMFLDEARLVAGLNHPNIPSVFELEEHEGLPFFVMEFVAGPNLVMMHRKLRDGRPRRWGHIAWIFERVARALHHAHTLTDYDGNAMHLVHRDVSLANILVGRDGHPKLIDFGIAKWDSAEAVTEVDVLKGKLRYMAPEQIAGKRPDARVDVFQCGVAMYWLSTGRPPFASTGALALRERGKERPPTPESLQHGYPEGLSQIVMRCIEPKPEDRFANALEFADALRDFMKSAPEFDCDERSLATWIAELFPESELDIYTSRTRTGTHEPSLTRPLPGHATDDLTTGNVPSEEEEAGSHPAPHLRPQDAQETSESPEVSQQPERISLVGWLGLVAVAVVSSVMTMNYNELRREAQIKQYRSQYAEMVESDPDAAAHQLLDRAEALLDDREVASADALLKQAGRIEDTSPEVAMRHSRLEVSVKRIRLVASARRALIGGDAETAIAKSSEVLDLLPEDPDALKILQDAQAQKKAEERKDEAPAADPVDEDVASR
jgi:serine/threonine protein kinase